MSIEIVSSTIMNVFGIRRSEGKMQNVPSLTTPDALGSEYQDLLRSIRNVKSKHVDLTSWSIRGNLNNL